MKRSYYLLFSLLLIASCSGESAKEVENAVQEKAVAVGMSIGIDELSQWQFLGMGSVETVSKENALRMSESEGSKGVTLVSKESYGENVILTFKVKPESYESVNVVVLSASNNNTGSDIVIPSDHDGAFGFWTQGDVSNYVFAFHNGAHNRKPFIIRNPGVEAIAEGPELIAGERWNDVEIGREAGKVWMKIDGKMAVEGIDSSSEKLSGGKIAFRLRGTPDAAASALFKDIVITEKE